MCVYVFSCVFWSAGPTLGAQWGVGCVGGVLCGGGLCFLWFGVVFWGVWFFGGGGGGGVTLSE